MHVDALRGCSDALRRHSEARQERRSLEGYSQVWVKQKEEAFDLWLACHTQEEIAEACECSQQTIADILPKMAELPKSVKPAAEHLTDFDVPIYNVWKYKENAHYEKRQRGNYPQMWLTTQPLRITRNLREFK